MSKLLPIDGPAESFDLPGHCSLSAEQFVGRRIVLRGRVQGLGVRPAIVRLAEVLGVRGSVSNSSEGVQVVVEGPLDQVDSFAKSLAQCMPDGAVIESRRIEACAVRNHAGFSILPSTSGIHRSARVPPDVAVCKDCLSEVDASENRRHGYAFTTCTACGPRYTVVDAMPYDRGVSAMADFKLCARCQQEYVQSHDRRFHSQTNCCPDCGPRLWLSDRNAELLSQPDRVVDTAIGWLRAGQIVAVRGVGGYQLLVDATSAVAVGRLRRRKHRRGKPLAILVANIAEAERIATISAEERRVLADPANPIVLVQVVSTCVAAGVTEGLSTIGLMLPTTVLHQQLASRFGRPLVVTSGNLEGQPLVFGQNEAGRILEDIADCVIHHDRRILRPLDDSVTQVINGKSATVRLARGLAPLPIDLDCRIPMVALGGHQKAAIALSNGSQAVLGPHVGDLDDEVTRRRYVEQIESMCNLYGARPQVLVRDKHPDYFTTRWAAERGVPTLGVQHHHAHVAAGMLERGWLDRTVVGVCWDGSGYGPDGTIWGGEFLIATSSSYRRVASLRPFTLPGGEAAIREPWRVALALVQQTQGAERAVALALPGVAQSEKAFLTNFLARPRGWPRTTSAGRLFDAVAALAIGVVRSEFEGQPAMLLESVCDPAASGDYPFPVCRGNSLQLDWRPVIAGLLADLEFGVAPSTIAMRFHRTLANGIVAIVQQFKHLPIVLCGGCFNNRVLTELVVERLDGSSSRLATPGIIPVGDGGLAAGQLAVAAARLAQGWQPCA